MVFRQGLASSKAAKWMVWLVSCTVACLSVTVSQSQARGGRHVHAGVPASVTITGDGVLNRLAEEWLSAWQMQQAQGHRLLRHRSPDRAGVQSTPHSHPGIERHQHAADEAGVIVVQGDDSSAQSTGGSGGSVLGQQLPMFGSPSAALTPADQAERAAAWPRHLADRVPTREVAPLLRPPAVVVAAGAPRQA